MSHSLLTAGLLPKDAAAALSQQIAAERDLRDAAATLLAKPKPKARVRGAARAPTAVENAVAASAAATAGLLGPAPGTRRVPKIHAQGVTSVACCIASVPQAASCLQASLPYHFEVFD